MVITTNQRLAENTQMTVISETALRDLFAGLALAGLIAADPDATLIDRCVHAYEYADAMLAQRNEKRP